MGEGRAMFKKDSVVAICPGHANAGKVVGKLQQSGIDIQKLSVVGNSAPAGVDKSGEYTAVDWIKKWGFPSNTTLFSISDIGPIAIGGRLVSAIAEGQDAGAAKAELSVLSAGLRHCGIPNSNVHHYETAVKSDNYIVIVHCMPDEVIRVKEILEPLQVVDIAVHHP